MVVSADTDFGTLLATREARFPSVVLLFRGRLRRPEQQAATLLGNLVAIEGDLVVGAVVVFESARIRVRSLPLVS